VINSAGGRGVAPVMPISPTLRHRAESVHRAGRRPPLEDRHRSIRSNHNVYLVARLGYRRLGICSSNKPSSRLRTYSSVSSKATTSAYFMCMSNKLTA
jgi:hypothetical protein